MSFSSKSLILTHQNLTLIICTLISLFKVNSDHNYNHKQSLLTTSISTHFLPRCDGGAPTTTGQLATCWQENAATALSE